MPALLLMSLPSWKPSSQRLRLSVFYNIYTIEMSQKERMSMSLYNSCRGTDEQSPRSEAHLGVLPRPPSLQASSSLQSPLRVQRRNPGSRVCGGVPLLPAAAHCTENGPLAHWSRHTGQDQPRDNVAPETVNQWLHI